MDRSGTCMDSNFEFTLPFAVQVSFCVFPQAAVKAANVSKIPYG